MASRAGALRATAALAVLAAAGLAAWWLLGRAPANGTPVPNAVYLRGDPVALALSEDGARLWRVDGALAREYEVDGARLELLRELPLDGPALGLAVAQAGLLVAAGARGLLLFELSEPASRARVLHAEEGLPCTDVALADGLAWATFGAREGSRLVALDPRSQRVAGDFALPPGVAWAVAARGERAWVALGEGGLARADLASGRAEPGPSAPEGRWSVVRDVALTDDHLVAACDGAGLGTVALDAPWSRATPLELRALELEGLPTYACRVAAHGARVAVGTNLAPVEAQEGAPYGLLGWVDARLRVGGVDPAEHARGAGEGWLLLERAQEGWRELSRAGGRGGWRSLALRGTHGYEQHLGSGLVVRDAASGAVRFQERPAGLAVVAADLLAGDPSLVLCGLDPAGSSPAGWLRRTSRGLEVDAGTRELQPLGLLPGPQWSDGDGTRWCLAGTPLGWRLWRVDAASPRASAWWDVAPPVDPDGATGAGYFSAALDGDLLLAARSRSAYGLVGASAAALAARARATAPGAQLQLAPLFQLRTHGEGADGDALFAWEPAPWRGASGELLLLLPCGFAADGRARWLVVAAREGGAEVLAELPGHLAAGHAVACDVRGAGAGARALVVDLLGEAALVDLSDPLAPRAVASWRAPPERFDGRPPNLLDGALEERAGGQLLAWIAAGRAGLVVLAYEPPDALRVLHHLPPQGWTASVRASHTAEGAVLLVGEQKGGLRLFERSAR